MKNYLEIFAKQGIAGLLVFVIVIFGLKYLEKLSEIQADLQNIKIELVKVQTSIIDKKQIEQMIDTKLRLVQLKYHSK